MPMQHARRIATFDFQQKQNVKETRKGRKKTHLARLFFIKMGSVLPIFGSKFNFYQRTFFLLPPPPPKKSLVTEISTKQVVPPPPLLLDTSDHLWKKRHMLLLQISACVNHLIIFCCLRAQLPPKGTTDAFLCCSFGEERYQNSYPLISVSLCTVLPSSLPSLPSLPDWQQEEKRSSNKCWALPQMGGWRKGKEGKEEGGQFGAKVVEDDDDDDDDGIAPLPG